MSRYRGPRLRIIRRLGKIPGLTNKISSRLTLPGQHGLNLSQKQSQFSIRLKEKQKLRFYYSINERQMVNYLKKAKKKKGSSGVELLILLEMRLDNIIFRAGLCTSILSARQLVTHGHVKLNDRIVSIPSFSCKPLDSVFINKAIIEKNSVNFSNSQLPSHLSFNENKCEVRVLSFANRVSVPFFINELLVIEYYSRKM